MRYTIVKCNVEGGALLDCSDCGPLGTYTLDDVSRTIYDHLVSHGVNMDTVELHELPRTPKENQ